MTGEGSPGDMNRGGRKKRSESNAEDWTRIRKDNHVRSFIISLRALPIELQT